MARQKSNNNQVRNSVRRSRKRNAKQERKRNAKEKKLLNEGFNLSPTGNIIAPSNGNGFTQKLMKSKVAAAQKFFDQRTEQIRSSKKVQPMEDHSMIEDLAAIEASGGEGTIEEVFSPGDTAGVVTTINYPLPVRKGNLKRLALQVILELIHRGIDDVFEEIVTLNGTYSQGELAYQRLLLEIYYFVSNRDPTLDEQAETVNRWLWLLPARVCQDQSGINWALSWANTELSFEDFFTDDDLFPFIENVTAGGINTIGGQVFARTNYIANPRLTEQQILDLGTKPYNDLITQLGDRMVDPMIPPVESTLPHAFSIPFGFGDEYTDFRYWASVRSPFDVTKNYRHTPYALSGFVDSVAMVEPDKLWIVQTYGFNNLSHFGWQLANTHENDPEKKYAQVYPMNLSLEDLARRATCAMVMADINVNQADKEFDGPTLTQSDSSVFHLLNNGILCIYLLNIVSIISKYSHVGAFNRSVEMIPFVGSTALPNLASRRSALQLELLENLGYCGVGHYRITDKTRTYRVVEVPTYCAQGDFNCTNSISGSLDLIIAPMFPLIGTGDITYNWASADANLVPYLSITGPDARKLCLTCGGAVSEISMTYSAVMTNLQPALQIFMATQVHEKYNYSGLLRLVMINERSPGTSDSNYLNFRMFSELSKINVESLIGPSILEYRPFFIARVNRGQGSSDEDIDVALATTIFRKVYRQNFTIQHGLELAVFLDQFAYTWPVHTVGSRFQPPKTGYSMVFTCRIMKGEGSWWAILRPIADGAEIALKFGSELARHLERDDIAGVLDKIGVVVNKGKKFLPGPSLASRGPKSKVLNMFGSSKQSSLFSVKEEEEKTVTLTEDEYKRLLSISKSTSESDSTLSAA